MKLIFFVVGLTLVLFLVGCSPRGMPASFTFDWSDGSCQSNSDCNDLEFGCGGGHIICTNVTEKYKNSASTCDIVTKHPRFNGFKCGCVEAENKCGWIK
ncbi:MAG TPA: hypothetical protein VI934_03155 [Candidatus Nanoarchaeia archaeon]|nr:hypothetical protein [Candidatus Nanoarchaeia archaeon]